MGRLTWEQAEALVDRAYNPYKHLDPSVRIIRPSHSEKNSEVRKFGQEFMDKLRKRLDESR